MDWQKLGVWRLRVYVDPHYTTFVEGALIEKKRKVSNLNHPNPHNTSFLPESREDKTEGRFARPPGGCLASPGVCVCKLLYRSWHLAELSLAGPVPVRCEWPSSSSRELCCHP